ncbi:unnamed protein product [Chilo suppressalis]|uniref:FP protein C-terminal domain-containing protein n=1 Tax=Chilo suppressalis TaxID=168631 RepID=A0ABN8BDN2_CHISP|nr:unnamed protein product [Chilo suppressalis]
MSVQRTPPKFASNPDLPATALLVEDTVINMRKRKQPDDEDMDHRMMLLEQKLDRQMAIFSSKMDEMISESIANALKSAITSEFSKISSTLDAISESVMELRNDNASLKKSLKDMDVRFTEIEQSLNFCNTRQDEFEKDLITLKKQIQLTSDLPDYVQTLEYKLAVMQQQARECNIEISNVPEKRNENLVNMVISLGTAVKQQILVSDIVAVHRVPHASQTDKRPKNIVVKLTSRIARDNIVAACRSKKNLDTEGLGLPGTVQKIYVNEHLTIQNKILFRECRERAKSSDYKYVWVK